MRVTPLFRSPEKLDEELDARRGDFAHSIARELKELKLKLVPDVSGASLEEHVETSLIDCEIGACQIIRVPPTTSVNQARDIEQKLTSELKKNCIVVTRNIEFCKVEPVDPKELAHLLKGIDNNGPTAEERATMEAAKEAEPPPVVEKKNGVTIIDKRGDRS